MMTELTDTADQADHKQPINESISSKIEAIKSKPKAPRTFNTERKL
jgi:hypothetical protein